MRYLILSVDYEIFGSGAGDVRQHTVDPARHMAEICGSYNVPLTVFFEVEEYIAFVSHASQLKRDLGYDPADLIRKQIVSLINQGHDIQLHLHPEWHGARYADGKWLLNPDKTTVDSLFESQDEVTDYIANRKKVIEEMAAEANSSHKVRAYRAGAFSAQPGRMLLAALADNGIFIDSSVVKGLHNAARGYDYRRVPSAKGPWKVSNDVARQDALGGVWEFPIYSVPSRRIQQLTFNRLRAKFSRNVPKEKQKEMLAQLDVGPRHPLKTLRFLWQPVPIKLDFHNLSPGAMVKWILSAPIPPDDSLDVIVSIGHTKEHIDNRQFKRFVAAVTDNPSVRIVSFDDLARLLLTSATNECKPTNSTLFRV